MAIMVSSFTPIAVGAEQPLQAASPPVLSGQAKWSVTIEQA